MPIPKIVITAGLMAAQMALNAMRKIEGPRLEDLSVTVADYGTVLNYFYGDRRFNGVPIFWAEPIKEEKKKRKTKGGKMNDYRYFGTWAVAVADHQIDAVTKIWFDKHLVYDVTGVGPITPLSKKVSINDVMRIYLGTETQEPDPRMQATVEAEFGAETCPAYRGVAYVMFEEVPLETFGNRIPQISVEAVSNGAPNNLYEIVESTHDDTARFSFSPGGHLMAYSDRTGGQIQWWDVPNRTILGFSGNPGFMTNSETPAVLSEDGTAYQMGLVLDGLDVDTYYVVTEPLGTPVMTLATVPATEFLEVTRVLENDDGELRVYTTYEDATGYINESTHIDHDWSARDFCVDGDGNFWGLFQPDGASSQFYIQSMDSADTYTFTGTARSDMSSARFCHVSSAGHFFVHTDGHFYLIDDTTFTITASGVAPWAAPPNLYENGPNATSFWDSFDEYSLIDGSLIRSLDKDDWLINSDSAYTYDPTNHAMWSRQGSSENVIIRYLDRVASDGVTLGSIVADICDRCGIEAADINVTDLTQIVEGYSWTQGSGKQIIEPLLDAYDSDCGPHNFQLLFKKRGSTSSGTLDVTEFIAKSPRYAITRVQDTDLVRALTFTFADPAGEQQPNSVRAQRPLENVDSVREAAIDMTTLVLDVDEARQLAERYLRRMHNARESYSLSLTAKRLALEPLDVWDLILDDVTRTARMTKMTVAADDTLGCEWVQDFPSLAGVTVTPGAPQDGRVPSVIVVPVPVKALILDIPLIRDADNSTNPLLYYGAGRYGASGIFPGAVLYQYDGTDYDLEVASVASDSAATWGTSTDALDDASSMVWDRGNSFNVMLKYGTPIAATEAACNANPRLNLAALGADDRWELLQYTTPTLQGDGSYTFTGLKRGRRGTEWATGTHATGDTFVLLNAVGHMEMGGGDIGDDLSFKMVTSGTDADIAIAADIDDYAAVPNRPWAPAQLKAVKDPVSGDIVFTWRRRSRVSGDFAPGTPPLGESTEEYDLNIYRSGFASPITRTITVSSETATYDAADQATDGGDLAWADIEAGVLQVGDLADGYETREYQ